MINLRIFIPWDLTFGTGFQTFGALVAALTVGWALNRADALRQLSEEPVTETNRSDSTYFLYLWIRFVVPSAIMAVGAGIAGSRLATSAATKHKAA